MSFPVKDLICDLCRVGLDQDFNQCSHLKNNRIKELATDFMNFEKNQKQESELCSNLDIWVDEPRFWEACLYFDQKLQLHQPRWIRKIFQKKIKSQIVKIISKIENDISGHKLKLVEKNLKKFQKSGKDEYENDILEQETQYYVNLVKNKLIQNF